MNAAAILTATLASCAAAGAASALASGGALAAPRPAASAIQVEEVWIRLAPPAASVLAGYMTLRNRGPAADTLRSVSCPLAGNVSIHEVHRHHGMVHMEALPGLRLAPGATVRLRPGEAHLMLTGLRRTPGAGERVPLSLGFDRAGRLEVVATVRAADGHAFLQAPAHRTGSRVRGSGRGSWAN